METKKNNYELRDVLSLLNTVVKLPTSYRLIVEMKRTRVQTWLNGKAYEYNDYYMFDMSNGESPIYDKFLVSGCITTWTDVSCWASKLNCLAFIMKMVRNQKVKRIYLDCF